MGHLIILIYYNIKTITKLNMDGHINDVNLHAVHTYKRYIINHENIKISFLF
jgi:hypothetical protein